jgi:hypothetical protein
MNNTVAGQEGIYAAHDANLTVQSRTSRVHLHIALQGKVFEKGQPDMMLERIDGHRASRTEGDGGKVHWLNTSGSARAISSIFPGTALTFAIIQGVPPGHEHLNISRRKLHSSITFL